MIRFSTILISCLIFLAGIQFATAISVATPKENPSSKGFYQTTIEAWRNAGALVGWLTITEVGQWRYLQNKPEGVDALAVFLWRKYIPNAMASLPKPSVPFAIGLGGSGLTNDGLKELARFQKLQALDISHTKVTDAGLTQLSVMKNLRSLDMGASSLTDAGLRNLAEVKSLQRLYFGATSVTDAGISTLAGLENLRVLYLYKTQLTDDGLRQLAEFTNLQRLLVSNTRVTDEGVAELLQRLPNLKIIR